MGSSAKTDVSCLFFYSTVFETVLFVNILAIFLLLSVHSAKKLITCGKTGHVFTSEFEAAAEPRKS